MKPHVYLFIPIFLLTLGTIHAQEAGSDIKLAARQVIDMLPNESSYNRIRCLMALKLLIEEENKIASGIYAKLFLQEGEAPYKNVIQCTR